MKEPRSLVYWECRQLTGGSEDLFFLALGNSLESMPLKMSCQSAIAAGGCADLIQDHPNKPRRIVLKRTVRLYHTKRLRLSWVKELM